MGGQTEGVDGLVCMRAYRAHNGPNTFTVLYSVPLPNIVYGIPRGGDHSARQRFVLLRARSHVKGELPGEDDCLGGPDTVEIIRTAY